MVKYHADGKHDKFIFSFHCMHILCLNSINGVWCTVRCAFTHTLLH